MINVMKSAKNEFTIERIAERMTFLERTAGTMATTIGSNITERTTFSVFKSTTRPNKVPIIIDTNVLIPFIPFHRRP